MWPTPNSAPTDYEWQCMLLPSSREWRRAAAGALLELTYTTNWEQFDPADLAPEDVAELFATLYDTRRRCIPMSIGDIFMSASDQTPPGCLECDGSELDTNDWPELFEAIHYAFGGGADVFKIPDLRYAFPLGVGTDTGGHTVARGGTGGSAEATIAVSNLPSHHHSIASTLTALSQLGVGELVHIPNPIPTSTGDTGGDEPLDIMPPHVGLRFLIVAKYV